MRSILFVHLVVSKQKFKTCIDRPLRLKHVFISIFKYKCNKFTVFFIWKGCTKGKHCNVKNKQQANQKKTDEPKEDSSEEVAEKVPRNPILSSFVDIPVTISDKLKNDRFELINGLKAKGIENSGLKCAHDGCAATKSASGNIENCTDDNRCMYHPGYPVFHEGYFFSTLKNLVYVITAPTYV